MQKLISSFKNISWDKRLVLIDQFLVSGSNFLLGILLVRSIGLEQYGVFTLLWMVILFALGINHAFITKPMLSLAPKMKQVEKENYLQSILWLQIILSSFLSLLGNIICYISTFFPFPIPNIEFGFILSFILFFQLFHDYFRKRCFIEDRLYLVLITDGILYLGQLLFIVAFWFRGGLNLNQILVTILVVNATAVIIVGIGFKTNLVLNRNFFESWKKQFHYSKWLLGTALLQWFSGNYFVIIAATILGPIAVGALRMAQNVMGFFHILFLSMENIVPIKAAKLFQFNGWLAMSQYLKNTTIKMGMIFLILLALLAGSAPWIIELLYGSEYLDYSYIIIVYCGLYVLVFLSLPLQFALRSVELTYPLFIAYILATIFSFICAHYFLLQWQMAGLLLGLFISQLITALTYTYYCWRYNQSYYSSKKYAKNSL